MTNPKHQYKFQNKQNKEIIYRFSLVMKYDYYQKLIESKKRKESKSIKSLNINEYLELTQSTATLYKKRNNTHVPFIREKKLSNKEKGNNGIIGINVNACPFYLTLTFTNKNGNLEKYKKISLNKLIKTNSEERQYLEWQIAHKIIKIAKKEKKAIIIENLQKLSKNKKEDELTKLRQKPQKWSYRRILNKIEVLAKGNEIELIKINPTYTPLPEYSPQYNIENTTEPLTKAKKEPEFKERLSKNHKESSNNTSFLSNTITKIKDNIKKIKQKFKKEKK